MMMMTMMTMMTMVMMVMMMVMVFGYLAGIGFAAVRVDERISNVDHRAVLHREGDACSTACTLGSVLALAKTCSAACALTLADVCNAACALAAAYALSSVLALFRDLDETPPHDPLKTALVETVPLACFQTKLMKDAQQLHRRPDELVAGHAAESLKICS